MKKWMTRSLLTGATILVVASAYTYSIGPDPGNTGADGERTCKQAGCHNTNPLNVEGGKVTLTGVPLQYIPGTKYSLTVQDQKPGQQRWGFELTAKLADRSRAGQFTITDPAHTQMIDAFDVSDTSPVYVEHTQDGTAKGQADVGPVWSFDWNAPAAGSGTVSFNVAGNCANGNDIETGDFIYTSSATSTEGSATPAILYGDVNGDGKVNVQDATLILQMAVGIVTATADQIKAGDVSPVPGTGANAGQPFGDGRINVSDATRILRRSVGLEPDPFPG